MTFGRASALAAGFIGAMALGAWVGPYVLHHNPPEIHGTPSALSGTETSTPTDIVMPAPSAARTAARDRGASTRVVVPHAFPASEPSLHERLKPLLNRGADMGLAADGFSDGEQFAAVAHAAKNTNVPFVLLKHRVLNEKKSLAAALKQSAPDIDAAVEAERARTEARFDIAALKG